MSDTLEQVRERILAKLLDSADDATQSLIMLATNADSEQVQLAAATKLLAIVGVSDVQRVEVAQGRSAEEVDHELSTVLQKIEEGRHERRLEAQLAIEASSTVVDDDDLDGDPEDTPGHLRLVRGCVECGALPDEPHNEMCEIGAIEDVPVEKSSMYNPSVRSVPHVIVR